MSKKKRLQRAQQPGPVESLKHQMQENGMLDKYPLAAGKANGRKISEVFLEFIAPFRATNETQDIYEKLIVTGIVAWNAALVTGIKRQKMIDNAVQAIVDQAGETWRKDAVAAIMLLLQHKERAFPADRRLIVDYRLTDTGAAYHLAMAAIEQP